MGNILTYALSIAVERVAWLTVLRKSCMFNQLVPIGCPEGANGLEMVSSGFLHWSRPAHPWAPAGVVHDNDCSRGIAS